MIESHRSFKTLFEQEERLLQQFEKRFHTLEPLSTNIEKLRGTTQLVIVCSFPSFIFSREFSFQDLFHDLLSRAQSIEHLNDVAVKFIGEVKVIFIAVRAACFACTNITTTKKHAASFHV